jgi:hypothetical protein
MKNKVLYFLLSAMLMAFLFGCGGGGSNGSSNAAAITSANETPVANAGTNQTVKEGSLAILDGSGSSDPDGDEITFSWTITAKPDGSSTTLADPANEKASFTVDLPGDYRIQLVVTDSQGAVSDPAEVLVKCTPNSAPVANAGEDQVIADVGTTVQLDGSQSTDPDGDAITFAWVITARPDGSLAALSNSAADKPTFVADVRGDYLVELVVNDGLVSSAPDSVSVSFSNLIPVADAGTDETVEPGELVLLDGTGSYDPDENYPLAYAWQILSKPEGSAAALNDPETVTASFTADLPGDYMVQLVVTDSLGAASDPSTIFISTSNSAPVANAGADQFIERTGVVVQLDGSLSFDPDGDPITHAWAITTKPNGSEATLSDPTAVKPSFVADLLGTYIIELVVSDPSGLVSAPDEVVASSDNVRPVADAGLNRVVFVGEPVQLDGSGSYDANLDPLSYSWNFADEPKGSTVQLSDSTVVNPTFIPDIQGIYIISLVVNDGELDSRPSNVAILAIDQGNVTPFIQALICAVDAINDLDDSDFDNVNNRNALTNKLISMIDNYLKGKFDQGMLSKLEEDVRDKMDGCVVNDPPAPDNDMIINCEAQASVYPCIDQAIAELEAELNAL